ncbi:glycoside hydrolase family 95 protein [bacterium]|nr:glycoside hydrolase family 95 protein [bacterium]
MQNVLHYAVPAEHFNEALPLGNGRLGAMFYGGVERERIHLNESSLWSGVGPAEIPPQGRAALPQIRRLLFSNQLREAHELAISTLPGAFTESYQPVGDLLLELTDAAGVASVTNYRRELDLGAAMGRTRFTTGGVVHERELLVSHPAQIVALRWRVDRPGALSCSLRFASPLRHEIAADAGGFAITGRAPSHVQWFGVKPGEGITYEPFRGRIGMEFSARCSVSAPGARVRVEDNTLVIDDATELTVLLDVRTAFSSHSPDSEAAATLTQARRQTWAETVSAHLSDHEGLFGRVRLMLSGTSTQMEELPTDQRLARRSAGSADPGLEALVFDYGRYLLIASSRPGGQPANLQGLWNREMQPPWSSNFTVNINTQMNYWPAEVCDLSELHTPLFDFIERLCLHGEITARELYGCDGWVCHHQTDLWASATPIGFTPGKPNDGASRYALWPMGAAWLVRHLWEHYLHNRDTVFLRTRAWPAMRGAAVFMLEFLVERPDGCLTTAPSTSPENSFRLADGFRAGIATGSTMDLSILRDLFSNCLDADRALGGTDPELAQRLRDALRRLPPRVITPSGRLAEWDQDYEEWEPHHRHVSHLYGLHPAAEIHPEETPALAEAARRTLEVRSDGGTGWSLAWKINFWARLQDAAHAHRLIDTFFHAVTATATDVGAVGGLYPNLLCAHPPFQIDGNFGYTAAVAELLLQSHRELVQSGRREIHLLPALPAAWSEGKASGLRARSGVNVSLKWSANALVWASLVADHDGEFSVRYGDIRHEVSLKAKCPWSWPVSVGRTA